MNGTSIAGMAGTVVKGALEAVVSTGVAQAPPVHFAILVFSAVLWMVSFFLLFEASRILKWMFAGEADAPNPRSGTLLFPLVSLVVVALWYAYRIYSFHYHQTYPLDLARILYHAPLTDPLEFVPGFILATIPLIVVGSLKLVTILVASGKQTLGGKPNRKPLMVALFYLIFNLLSAGASAATLLQIFRSR